MDSILKLFTRCMACAVIATPLCAFASLEVYSPELTLADVKFDFTKQAADFKAATDKKVKQAQDIQNNKKRSFGKWFLRALTATIVGVYSYFGSIFCFWIIASLCGAKTWAGGAPTLSPLLMHWAQGIGFCVALLGAAYCLFKASDQSISNFMIGLYCFFGFAIVSAGAPLLIILAYLVGLGWVLGYYGQSQDIEPAEPVFKNKS